MRRWIPGVLDSLFPILTTCSASLPEGKRRSIAPLSSADKEMGIHGNRDGEGIDV
jgi:hypothetical protein